MRTKSTLSKCHVQLVVLLEVVEQEWPEAEWLLVNQDEMHEVLVVNVVWHEMPGV